MPSAAAENNVHPAALNPTIRTSGEFGGSDGWLLEYLRDTLVATEVVMAIPSDVPN
jgi:hypothetical protein